MRIDKELQMLLAKKLLNYRDRVPVFKIRHQNASELHKEAVNLALPHMNLSKADELRFDGVKTENHVLLRLSNNAMLHYFPRSGYKKFEKNTPEFLKPVSHDATQSNKQEFEKIADHLLEKNRLNLGGSFERVSFENLFLLKSAGVSSDKKLTPVVLNRLVYAYRRFINELPVLGCASVFIKTAAEYALDAFGIDWRYIHEDVLTTATIMDPEDAARLALEQLQNINPEKVFRQEQLKPISFELGYFSHSKSMYQTVMQPVYVAKFEFRGSFRMGHLVIVPASGSSYESICRKLTGPPATAGRPDAKYRKEKMQPSSFDRLKSS